MKKCGKCGEEKPLSDFHRNKVAKDGRQSQCKVCNLARVKQWQKENPTRFKESWKTPEVRFRQRAKRYGLSPEQLEDLIQEYSGGCPLCGSMNLVVDHDHVTNEVRGMLCQVHNKALGMLGDSVEGLQAAIDYLEGRKH